MRPLVGTAQALGIVSIAALERARQRNDAAQLSLLAEVETLRGIVARVPTNAPPADAPALPADAASPAAPSAPAERSRIGIPGVGAAVADRAYPRCRSALTATQYGTARRWGHCARCRPADAPEIPAR